MRTDHFLHDVANPSSRDLKLHFSYLSENLLVSVTQAGNFISITTFELYVPIQNDSSNMITQWTLIVLTILFHILNIKIQ